MASHLLALLTEGELAKTGILEHFTDLVRGSVDNKSDLKGLSNIEVFSYFLRKNKFAFEEFLPDRQLADAVNREKLYKKYVTAVAELQKGVQRAEDNRAYLRPDLMQEYAALRTAGVSVGESNCYHLGQAIKRLAIEHQARSIRFWGKILGYQDYWVVQGASAKPYLDEVSEGGEKYGSGVNTYSYWVATDPLGQWTELPLVTAQQVAASRTFKYIFTGELELKVNHSSSFNGHEKHLVICTLVSSNAWLLAFRTVASLPPEDSTSSTRRIQRSWTLRRSSSCPRWQR
jgi:hypothetical protein